MLDKALKNKAKKMDRDDMKSNPFFKKSHKKPKNTSYLKEMTDMGKE